MKKVIIKGSLSLQQAFCKESGIDYFSDWSNRDYDYYPNLYRDGSESGRFIGCTDNYITRNPDYKVFNLPTEWYEALEYVKDVTVPFGNFKAIIYKDEKTVFIDGRGYLKFEDCLTIWNKIKPEEIGGYVIIPDIKTVTFGCVKNIPYDDVANVIKIIDE